LTEIGGIKEEIFELPQLLWLLLKRLKYFQSFQSIMWVAERKQICNVTAVRRYCHFSW